MNHHYTTTGIIIGQRNIFEMDKILTVLTKENTKIQIYAKGSRKITSRRNAHIELLNKVTFYIYRSKRETDILQQCEIRENFMHIKKDLRNIAAASYLAEITDKLMLENHPIPQLFQTLEQSLILLNQQKTPEKIVAIYIIKLLSLMGLLPDFEKTNVKGKQTLANIQKKHISAGLMHINEEPIFQYANRCLHHYLDPSKIQSEKFIK